jgi:hypothetical protein
MTPNKLSHARSALIVITIIEFSPELPNVFLTLLNRYKIQSMRMNRQIRFTAQRLSRFCTASQKCGYFVIGHPNLGPSELASKCAIIFRFLTQVRRTRMSEAHWLPHFCSAILREKILSHLHGQSVIIKARIDRF